MISDDDKKRITDAIREAERKTSGEIFCVVAHKAGNYRTIPFALAAGFSLIVPLPFILWSNWPASAIYTAQLAVFIALAIIFTLPAIRFRIVPRRRKHERAHAEAMSQFFAHGLAEDRAAHRRPDLRGGGGTLCRDRRRCRHQRESIARSVGRRGRGADVGDRGWPRRATASSPRSRNAARCWPSISRPARWRATNCRTNSSKSEQSLVISRYK